MTKLKKDFVESSLIVSVGIKLHWLSVFALKGSVFAVNVVTWSICSDRLKFHLETSFSCLLTLEGQCWHPVGVYIWLWAAAPADTSQPMLFSEATSSFLEERVLAPLGISDVILTCCLLLLGLDCSVSWYLKCWCISVTPLPLTYFPVSVPKASATSCLCMCVSGPLVSSLDLLAWPPGLLVHLSTRCRYLHILLAVLNMDRSGAHWDVSPNPLPLCSLLTKPKPEPREFRAVFMPSAPPSR